MPPHPVIPRFARILRKASARLRSGHVAALSVAAFVALGLAGLRAVELPGPRPLAAGDRLRIEVVHPVEPEIAPGSVMEVGELVDGFQGLPPAPPQLTDALWDYQADAEAWPETYAPRPVAGYRGYEDADRAGRREPERESPARMVQRWFGFDAPRRDFQAERAVRRARLEAMERREEALRDREAARAVRRSELHPDADWPPARRTPEPAERWEREARDGRHDAYARPAPDGGDRDDREVWRPTPRERPPWRNPDARRYDSRPAAPPREEGPREYPPPAPY